MPSRFPRLHLILLGSLLLLPASPSPAATIERVVAIVNDEVITQSELEQESQRSFAAIRKNTAPGETAAKLAEARKKVLQGMIEERLLAQKAKELKFETMPAEVEESVTAMLTAGKLNREKFKEELANEGLSEDEYRLRLAEQISRSKLINSQIRSKIVISEERAKKHYQEVYLKETPPPGYYLLQMGFRWNGNETASTTKEEARLRAERIRKLVQDGQDFRELARSFSELPSAKDGGDLGALLLTDMAPDMRELLSDLTPGQISRVAEASESIQFFQVLTINTADTPRYPAYELVSNAIHERLFQEEMKNRLENWMKELREQAMISIIN
ncbi:MAG: hypothetical protein HGA96_11075 [Desulfobulbaceae bacterium]|nr:hypothetical protein [Desulfobulbaceae bacterium]